MRGRVLSSMPRNKRRLLVCTHTFICGYPCLPLRHGENPASRRNETRYVRKRLESAQRVYAPCGGRATDFGPDDSDRELRFERPRVGDSHLVGCYAHSTTPSGRWVASTCSTLLVTRYLCFPLDHYLISLKRHPRRQNPHPYSHKTTFSILSPRLLFLR